MPGETSNSNLSAIDVVNAMCPKVIVRVPFFP